MEIDEDNEVLVDVVIFFLRIIIGLLIMSVMIVFGGGLRYGDSEEFSKDGFVLGVIVGIVIGCIVGVVFVFVVVFFLWR